MPISLLAALVFAPPVSDSSYMQSAKTPAGKFEIRTAARRLTAPGKPDVWLVSTVHVARPDYYKALQGLLDAQKRVLYEGVDDGSASQSSAEEDAPVEEQGEAPKDLYGTVAKVLGLQSQGDGIDYDRANWTNCDLTFAELDRLDKQIAKGKRNGYEEAKAMLDPNSKEGKEAMDLFRKMTPGVAEALKIMLIRLGNDSEMPSDPVYDEIVLKARNKHVLDTIGKIVYDSPNGGSIGAFYGAGHMPEMQNVLVQKYGYRLGERRWFLAMDADANKLDADGKKLLNLFAKRHPAAAPSRGKAARRPSGPK